MADAIDECAPGALGELVEGGIPGGALGAAESDLDELVIVEGALGLAHHGIGKPGAADLDHGLQGVRASAQEAALSVGELHIEGEFYGQAQQEQQP